MKKNILLLILGFITFSSANAQSVLPIIGSNQQNALLWTFNQSDHAEAYSWLSKDGKRIYFTKDDTKEAIWMAERKSLTEAFQNPVAIKIEGLIGENEIFSSWLTQDESTLYFVSRESDEKFITFLYKAKYNSQTKQFENPQRIKLNMGEAQNESAIFISGPSLSSDLSELYLYFSGNNNTDRIAYFKSEDKMNYTFHSFVNKAENYCPGSLSDDGLSYFLTLREESNILVKLSRTQLNTEFSKIEYFTIDTNRNHGKNYYQPHVNSDLGILSITYGTGTWQSNNIDIIAIPHTQLKDYQPSNTEVPVAFLEAEEVKPTFYTESKIDIDTAYSVVAENESNTSEILAIAEPDVTPTEEEDKENRKVQTSRLSLIEDGVSVELYPNPANNLIRLNAQFGNNSPTNLLIEILDLSGKIIYSEQIAFTDSEIKIETSYLKEGIYFCKITSPDKQSFNKKFIVKHG